METKKVTFFKRVKDAIINFDEYIKFSEEKVSIAIKYIFKLAFIFTIIITIAVTVEIVKEAKGLITSFENEAPDFYFKNAILEIEDDNKKIVKGDENGYIGFIVDSEKENLRDVQESANYQRTIGLLKDKIVVKDVEGIEASLTYEQLGSKYDLNNINKNSVLQFLHSNNMTKIYIIFSAITFIYFFMAYLLQLFLDILVLSILAYLISKIIGIKFKYKSIFNISTYAITLSAILYLLYMVINLYTGFTIKYFEMAYNGIAYIYVVTVMLMMKSDLIKQQIEVGKIVEEQKKVREEKKKEEQEDKEEKPKKEKKENKEEKQEEGTPEGNQA